MKLAVAALVGAVVGRLSARIAWPSRGVVVPPPDDAPVTETMPDPVLAATSGPRGWLARLANPKWEATIMRGLKTIAAGMVAAVGAYQGDITALFGDPRAIVTVLGAGVVLAAQKFASWTD